jgi:hypothetical protein
VLNWNAQKVKNLTPGEIWLFIVARVLVAFGLGALAAKYFPAVTGAIAIPVIALGLMMFALAARGLFRSTQS